jgi:hypothetical protein
MGLDRLKTFEVGEFFPCEHKQDQRIVRRLVQSDPAYAAMIESLDENVGRVNFRPIWAHRFSAKVVHSQRWRTGNSC